MNLGPNKIFCEGRMKISYMLGVSFPKKKEKHTRFINLLWAFTSQNFFQDTWIDISKVHINIRRTSGQNAL